MASIIYTKTDEAPLFATYSLLPIITAYLKRANVEVKMKDISLAGRIIANFSEYLPEDLQINDDLALLGELTKDSSTNIIKLPNISASIPQLKAAIKELQENGYAVPDFPEEATNEQEKKIKAKYSKILGSAVNPVLREGNSDRRAPKSVKNYAKKNPYKIGHWDKSSKTHVAHMNTNDFFANEKSHTFANETSLKVEFIGKDGNVELLKENLKILKGEVVDATFLSYNALSEFAKEQIKDAKAQGVLFSLHLKATMMKVSDPVMFGCFVNAYFEEVFKEFQAELKEIGFNPNNGLGDLFAKLNKLDKTTQDKILSKIQETYQSKADLAMVNSDKGITNLHVPSDVIVDASMPSMIRNSGKMWDKNNSTRDTKAVIPDRTYARVYYAVIEDCKKNGALDPAVIGSVSNVGLMAQKAEEYGSHDKTFIMKNDGIVRVSDSNGVEIFTHEVCQNDIYRMCQAKDEPIKDWVKLAVTRARDSQTPAVFWLDEKRAHDREIIKKVEIYLKEYDLSGLDISIMSPEFAAIHAIQRMRDGKDTISVTGNVLRDYNTDLFPILELGTSAKMLSIVPLMNGGGLFETGAGGSAPKHVEQLLNENHLRWDSLGEFLALGASLEHFSKTNNNKDAGILAQTLDKATEALLDKDKSPSRKTGELDNRGSHFYLCMYWARELANQSENNALADTFKEIADKLEANETQIINELNNAQGKKVDCGGYYLPKDDMAKSVMRGSQTFNEILQILEK